MIFSPPRIIVRRAGKEERASIEQVYSAARRSMEDDVGRPPAQKRRRCWVRRWSFRKTS